MMYLVILCALLLVCLLLKPNKTSEKELKCPHCGTTLRHFDTDSQGGFGYICDNCKYTTWV